jgi:hypothetical protein
LKESFFHFTGAAGMDIYDTLNAELDSIDRYLSRRGFLKLVVFASVPLHVTLDGGDREFLRKVAATLIPSEAFSRTGIDISANIEYLLARGSVEHRAKVMRLLTWSRRISFLYDGQNIARRAGTSRFVLIRKMSKALSALCLAAFWGDDRALQLIEVPEVKR